MFIRFSSVLPIAALAAVVAAAPSGTTTTSNCSSGSNFCCNSAQDPTSTTLSELTGLLGLNLSGVTGLVGLSCTSILGSNSCTEQNVCCTGDSFSGLIVLGCDPINLNVL